MRLPGFAIVIGQYVFRFVSWVRSFVLFVQARILVSGIAEFVLFDTRVTANVLAFWS